MSMEIEVFKSSLFGEVRTTIMNGDPWFVGKDVAEALGYSRTADAIAAHVDEEDKGVCEMPTPGGKQQMILINESGLYSLTFASQLPNAKQFKHWVTAEVIPSIRKTGSYSVSSKTKVSVDEAMTWVKFVSDDLHLSNSARLLFYKQCGDKYGLPIPDYVESKGVVHSATELLKRNGISLSARAFNRLALAGGYLQTMTRQSHKGIKEYRNLTAKGLNYGENQVNPNNPKETQPMYYDDTFVELCRNIGITL